METENVNEKNGIDEFVDEFGLFYKKIMSKTGMTELVIRYEDVVTLYAIYKKNGRAEAMNGNSYGYKKKSDPNAPATDKQKSLIGSLIRKGKVQQTSLDGLTKRDASRLLDEAFGKGRGSSPSSSSLPKLYETENVPVEEKMIHQKWEMANLGFYWLIAEYDPEKQLAFGYANLNDDWCAEWGYCSIKEIEEHGAKQVKEWKPVRFKEIKHYEGPQQGI